MFCDVDSTFWESTRQHLIRYGRAGVMFIVDGDAPDIYLLSKMLSADSPLVALLTSEQSEETRHTGGLFYMFQDGDQPVTAPPRLLKLTALADPWPDIALRAVQQAFNSDSASDIPGRGLLLGIEIMKGREHVTLGLSLTVVTLCGQRKLPPFARPQVASDAEADLGTNLLKRAVEFTV